MTARNRLEMLLQLTASPSADSFAFYALGMEYKSQGKDDEAIEAFSRLRARDPQYLPMYLICGTMLSSKGDKVRARDWLEAGLSVARAAKNQHAASEIESALLFLNE